MFLTGAMLSAALLAAKVQSANLALSVHAAGISCTAWLGQVCGIAAEQDHQDQSKQGELRHFVFLRTLSSSEPKLGHAVTCRNPVALRLFEGKVWFVITLFFH